MLLLKQVRNPIQTSDSSLGDSWSRFVKRKNMKTQEFIKNELFSSVYLSIRLTWANIKCPYVTVGLYRRFAKLTLLKWKYIQKKSTKCDYFFVFAQTSMGPVLIESSANSTMPTYPEHLLTPSELGDMTHFSWGVQLQTGGPKTSKKTENPWFLLIFHLFGWLRCSDGSRIVHICLSHEYWSILDHPTTLYPPNRDFGL